MTGAAGVAHVARSGVSTRVAELLVPALRWERSAGFESQRALIDRSLELGVGGFIIFGGTADGVRQLTSELSQRSREPLLIGADLERGAGQQFDGCTGFPPLAALGSLRDPAVMRAAGAITAREARALGLNWVYAPSLDLDVEPENPIIGTRAIGGDPATVAELGGAWIEGCQAQRVLACAKHFPGHGRTTSDSHAELPIVDAPAELIERTDLHPFREAIRRGVASVMSAHVAYPALDNGRGPATLSRAILRTLLRERLGFEGLAVTDALIMAGVLQGESEGGASVRALAAGCDLLLYPSDVDAVARELRSALDDGRLSVHEVERSLERRRNWAAWSSGAPSSADFPDRGWAGDVACRVVHVVRGDVPRVAGAARVTVIDDDVGGPYPPPSREPFAEHLRALGVEAGAEIERADALHIIALYGDIRAWKGRPGYSARALGEVQSAAGAASAGERVLIVQFSHPRLANTIGTAAPIVCAWGGEAVMQRAAAEWLVNRCGGN